MQIEKSTWKGRTGGGRFGQWFLLTALRHIRVIWFYPILYVVIPIYVLFDCRNRRIVYRYFRHRQGFSWWRSSWATLGNYICFGKVVIDKFAVAAGRSDQFKVAIEGEEHILPLIEGEQGFIMASAHIGNFELVGHCLSQNRKQIYGIIYGGDSAEYVKQRIESFKQTHVTLIPVMADMSHLFAIKDALDGGNIVSLQCDRTLGSSKEMSLPFLNGEASFPLGVFRIAAQLEVPVLTVFVVKESTYRYRAFVKPLQWDDSCSNSVKQSMALCRQYVDELAIIVKKYPQQWFNYYNFWKERV